MRKLIVFLLFIFNSINSYCQDEFYLLDTPKDTITLGINDIETTRDTHVGRICVGYSLKYYIVKETKKKLNGFYKIIINDDNYYTGHFNNGFKSLKNDVNAFKYYQSGSFTNLELHNPRDYGTPYYFTIFNYSENLKKLKLKLTNDGFEKVLGELKQKKCEGFFIWNIKLKDGSYFNYKLSFDDFLLKE